MALRKPVDEWSTIIQKQSDLNRLRESEDRVNKNVEKVDYRKDLLFQQQLRDFQKKDELSLKQVEAVEINQRVNYYKQQEDVRRQQETQLKKQMGEDYTMQQNYVKQKDQEEKQRKYQQEQEHLARVRADLDAEERRKKEARERWTIEQQQMLNYKKEQEMMKREAEMQEKQYDLELIRQRKQREEMREQNYRDYYQKLNQHQTSNVERLNQYMTRDTKDQERATWIDKNVAEQNSLLAQKDEYEKYLRQMNIRNNNLTLKQQMEEKEKMRMMATEEQRRQAEEHRRRIEESKRLENEREMQKRFQKMQYSEDLSMQKTVWSENQLQAYKLSDHEKKFNRNMIDDKALLQRGGAQILRGGGGNTNSYDENMQKFFGSDSQSRTPQPVKLEKVPFENMRKPGAQSFSYNKPY